MRWPAELVLESEPTTSVTAIRSPSDVSRLEVSQTDGRRRRVDDRRLAFDLRSQASRRSSSLAPSTVSLFQFSLDLLGSRLAVHLSSSLSSQSSAGQRIIYHVTSEFTSLCCVADQHSG